ncbi:hypothetical protein [Nocardia abscessus]|uniref:hypothetical protein n=1 Tax=Nocardia abscessus TaxID=120957 RepID=UPI002453FF5D|nr:hypothetical protein [Nocardia abscessus]
MSEVAHLLVDDSEITAIRTIRGLGRREFLDQGQCAVMQPGGRIDVSRCSFEIGKFAVGHRKITAVGPVVRLRGGDAFADRDRATVQASGFGGPTRTLGRLTVGQRFFRGSAVELVIEAAEKCEAVQSPGRRSISLGASEVAYRDQGQR